MKRIFLVFIGIMSIAGAFAQEDVDTRQDTRNSKKESVPVTDKELIVEKVVAVTGVKNQSLTGTCWSFATTSLVESQFLKKSGSYVDLSEMYTVRKMYIEKAKNYVSRQGHAQFGEGGLGHDVIRSMSKYGAMPLYAYTGLIDGEATYNHSKMVALLKNYLDSLIGFKFVYPAKKLAASPTNRSLPANWLAGYNKIMDAAMGKIPENFMYNNRQYTPETFAKDVLGFDASDYVNITSFTHQPYYRPFIIDVPDNFSNGSYYNLPLKEMIDLVKNAVRSGYSVLWDADVSNDGFMQKIGYALNISNDSIVERKADFSASTKEKDYDATTRQMLFENLTTQDDHLMHIVGLERSKEGKSFFVVKNSWGNIGPFNGYINVSENYFAINTISLVVPRAAIDKATLAKLGLSSK